MKVRAKNWPIPLEELDEEKVIQLLMAELGGVVNNLSLEENVSRLQVSVNISTDLAKAICSRFGVAKGDKGEAPSYEWEGEIFKPYFKIPLIGDVAHFNKYNILESVQPTVLEVLRYDGKRLVGKRVKITITEVKDERNILQRMSLV